MLLRRIVASDMEQIAPCLCPRKNVSSLFCAGGRWRWSCVLGMLVTFLLHMREIPECAWIASQDRRSWPRCLSQHSWLLCLSGNSVGSPWAANLGDVFDHDPVTALDSYPFDHMTARYVDPEFDAAEMI